MTLLNRDNQVTEEVKRLIKQQSAADPKILNIAVYRVDERHNLTVIPSSSQSRIPFPLAESNYYYTQEKNIKPAKSSSAEQVEQWLLQVGYKSPNVQWSYIENGVIYFSFAAYWVLFVIWAIIQAYHRKRLSIIWILAFSVLNVIAYGLFVGTERMVKRHGGI